MPEPTPDEIAALRELERAVRDGGPYPNYQPGNDNRWYCWHCQACGPVLWQIKHDDSCAALRIANALSALDAVREGV